MTSCLLLPQEEQVTQEAKVCQGSTLNGYRFVMMQLYFMHIIPCGLLCNLVDAMSKWCSLYLGYLVVVVVVVVVLCVHWLSSVSSPSPRRDRHRSKSPRRHRSRSRERRHRSKSPGKGSHQACNTIDSWY